MGKVQMKPIGNGILAAAAASLLVLAACSADKTPDPTAAAAKGAAVATVNGKAISKSRVDMIVEQGARSGRPDSPESPNAGTLEKPLLPPV